MSKQTSRTCEEVERDFASKLAQVQEVEREQLESNRTTALSGLNYAVKPTRILSSQCTECGKHINSRYF